MNKAKHPLRNSFILIIGVAVGLLAVIVLQSLSAPESTAIPLELPHLQFELKYRPQAVTFPEIREWKTEMTRILQVAF